MELIEEGFDVAVVREGVDIGDGEGVRGEGGRLAVIVVGDRLSSDNVRVPHSDEPTARAHRGGEGKVAQVGGEKGFARGRVDSM